VAPQVGVATRKLEKMASQRGLAGWAMAE
jgi:hypothetical protein